MKFLSRDNETLPGILLLLCGALAMLLANSSLAEYYFKLIHIRRPASVLFVVNDIFMAIFFLEVGLEIKQQVVTGHLSKPKQVILPALAALGGVIMPAVIYVALNLGDPMALSGWAVPTATDIAFALGIIMLLGNLVPITLRVLLLTIAVVDDLVAIIIIAMFYSQNIIWQYLMLGSVCLLSLIYLNIKHERNVWLYLFVGMVMWFCLLNAGIHPTISGVLTGLVIPMRSLHGLHKPLKSCVAFFILPVFAFANAGVSLTGVTLDLASNTVPLGIALGLIFGKQLGVFLFARIAVAYKIASLPKEINWAQFYGMALLCGIGFTMSIFISNLAFSNIDLTYAALSKFGILVGSTISAILGYAFLLSRSVLYK